MTDICESIGFPKCSPHCHHGGRPHVSENGTCSCLCGAGWTGRDCSKCDILPASCMHEGQLLTSGSQCECNCSYPWTGVHCDICNRNCAHGSSNPMDPHCKCQCTWPWTGIECERCDLECFHSGKKINSLGKCQCQCPPLAEGPQCEQCTARCLNGGVLDKHTCTCKCVGGFSGHQCETCDVSCQHNGTFIANECRCQCDNPWTAGPRCEVCRNDCHGRGREVGCNCVDCQGYWNGPSCNNCTLNCVNEGELDPHSCKCACDKSRCRHGQPKDDCSCSCDGYWRGEQCHECHLNCLHGTLNKANCSCHCEGSFSGPKCDRCEKNCTDRGVLDASKCQCTDCQSPYYGFDCAQKCPKNCQHGSQLNAEACACEQCPLPWLGAECNVCKLTLNHTRNPCGPFGTFDAANCLCVCEEGWTGERCNKCSRQCSHGVLNPTDCSCACDAHWIGTNCSECNLECQSGGVLDKKNCYCECDRLHSGTTCQGGPCHMQQACDSCLTTSDGCEWCAGTASCDKAPGPGATTACAGPSKQGLCPLYGECHMCDYSPDELAWLALHGERTGLSGTHSSSMPEAEDNHDMHPDDVARLCDSTKSETWCEPKRICVQDWVGGMNGPCHVDESVVVNTHRRSLNGFIGAYDPDDFKN